MKVKKTTYPGWSKYPCYHVRTDDDFKEICQWMGQHGVENFMLSSGSNGYVFQVKSNVEWFELKWS